MRALRSFQLKSYFLDFTNKHHVRNSRTSFISIEQQSQNPTFSRHFYSTDLLRVEDDTGNYDTGNYVGSSSTRERWSVFGDDSGTSGLRGLRTPLVEAITSSVRENDDGEEVESLKGGESEVGSVGSRKSWVSSSSYSVDSGTGNSWTPFVDTIMSSASENDDLEEMKLDEGGENSVGSVGPRKSWCGSSSYDVNSGMEGSWTPFNDTITSSVRKKYDVEVVDLNKGGENKDVEDTKLDGGVNEVNLEGSRKRWRSSSSYGFDSGMMGSCTPFVDPIASRVRKYYDLEDFELNEGGENEVDSADSGHEKLDRERSNEGGNSGTRPSWSSFGSRVSSSVGNNDVEEVEANEGGENEVNLAKLSGEKLERERTKWGGPKVNSVGPGYDDPVLKMKKGRSKDKVNWVCSNCGYSDGIWRSTCLACSGVGTIVKFSEGDYGGLNRTGGVEVVDNMKRTWLLQHNNDSRPQRLTDVNRRIDQLNWRFPLCGMFGAEVARVLGGGLVPGSLVLVGGDPGVGKSTLLLQIAGIISDGSNSAEPSSVVYVSGEECMEQIGNRADRMGIKAENIYFYCTDIEALIIDSIQSVYLKGVTGSAGAISQVTECASALLRFSKTTKIPVFLIGHVNKTGDIAGPRVLEHIVDVVLYMEGDESSSHRLLRPVKNRFGSTDELGVFEMSQSGLQAVLTPSEMFLSEPHSKSDIPIGQAVAVIMDGSRFFLYQIQALCVSESKASSKVNGVEEKRARMIICVLMKQAGVTIEETAVVVNVGGGGVSLKETAGDLAIAAAICSSVLECPILRGVAFIGEIGLGGELRMVPRMEKRLNTLAKLGYKKCIVPESAMNSLAHLDFGEMNVVGCMNLKAFIKDVFPRESCNSHLYPSI